MNHTQAAECYICPEGHYCVNRVTPEPCPAGKGHVLDIIVIITIHKMISALFFAHERFLFVISGMVTWIK